MLLGIATVGTAWCGYQSAMWNGTADDLNLEAAESRIESSRLFSLATQQASYDASMIARYSDAYQAKQERRMAFYRESLIRPQFLPILDKWQAQADRGEFPENLLEDEQYQALVLGDYLASEAKGASLDATAQAAGTTGDSYVMMTVLLAISLFFAGVTTSFTVPGVRMVLLAGCLLIVGVAAARIVDLPIAPGSFDFLSR